MNNYDVSYLDVVSDLVEHGEHRETRAGPTRQAFGAVLGYDGLSNGLFPLLTTRKLFYKPVLGELAAFLRGAETLAEFKEFGCNYWDANAAAWPRNKGLPVQAQRVGKIYGAQWRKWHGPLDQIKNLVDTLKFDPDGRRHLLTTYNPAETHLGCLPPCHLLAQFNITNARALDCIVYMRSVDMCLGFPSDMILYATLLLLLAKEVRCTPGRVVFMLGDTHIYENHVALFKQQYASLEFELPRFKLSDEATLDNFVPEHLEIIDYYHGGRIDYPFAV